MNQTDFIGFLVLVFPPLCSICIPVCRLWLEMLPANQRSLLRQLVSEIVDATEQLGPPNKKQAATNLILAEAKRHHIKVTADQISYLIETFVYALNNDRQTADTIQIPVVKAPKTGA